MATNDSETSIVSAVFPRALRESITRSAQQHDRSLSAEIREAVRAYVAGMPGDGEVARPSVAPPSGDYSEAA